MERRPAITLRSGHSRSLTNRNAVAYYGPGMPMKVREVIRLLEQQGWVEMR
jgi:hypothetical protein